MNISQEARIDIQYDVLSDKAQVCFALTVFDGGGACVFSSLNNRDQSYGRGLAKGTYISGCHIYGDLLNEGRFSITIVGFSRNWSDSFALDHVISFDAIDDGKLKGDYYGGYGGGVRPRLLWTTNRVRCEGGSFS